MMQFEIKKEKNVMVIKPLERRLEARGAKDFRNAMEQSINAGNNLLVVDLSNVDFIDSNGLNAIVFGLKLIGQGGNLALSGVKNTIKSLLRLTRMNHLFKIFETQEDAVKGLTI